MTDLQIGLIGLGTVAVVGVLAFNKWQEMRHRKLAEQVLHSDHDDVLLGRGGEEARQDVEDEAPPATVQVSSERREPMLGVRTTIAADLPWDDASFAPEEAISLAEEAPPVAMADRRDFSAGAEERQEIQHEAQHEAQQEAGGGALPPAEIPVALLDPRVDFIVVMELVEPVAAEQILYSQREALLRLNKPVRWVGFNDRQREWEIIPPGSERSYRRLRIGLQLADRRGPLSDVDFTIFVAAVQQLADELMAVANMSPRQSVIDQALALDHFCAEVDLEIGVHLVSRATPFSGTKIRALAEAAGMVLTAEGLFARHDDDGRIQFRLQNFENSPFLPDSIKSLTTHGLTFLLDVPRVDHGERVFFQMVDNARRFADALQGQLVDDNRQPLNETQLDRIKREYVVKPQASMAKFGLAAGSPQALRLFS